MLNKWITGLAAAAIALGALAAQPLAQAYGQTAPGNLDDPKDVESFFDGFMASQLLGKNIAGAEVAVVKDGKIVLVKGYGYADLEQRTPVDAEKTLFRPGSVSKLFIWTAVMQQVEQGKIDLNADVNTYLTAFKIPEAFGKPITMRNLMTHTPGFEDQGKDLFVADPAKIMPLEDYLKTHIPARVFPPGQVSAYSNYGASLAAYIVQEVSGMPFDEYVEKNIFGPLGMAHSTFRQPLPDALKADMSQGYKPEGALLKAAPFELVQSYPAGSLSAPAGDMALFMIAHLQDGEYNGGRILKAETAREMHAQLWTPSPEIEGMAHGFYSTRINGVRVIQHGGDTALFHTLLMLIPEKGVGVYVSYNSLTAATARGELQLAFMDRYFPADHPALKPPADMAQRINRYTGYYVFARQNYTTPEHIAGLFQQVNISAGPDGTLLAPSLLKGGASEPYVEVEPGVFQKVGDDSRLVFVDDGAGQVKYAYLSDAPMMGAYKLSWFEAVPFNAGVAITCILLFLTGVFAAPVGLCGPRVKPPEVEPYRWRRRLARWLAFAHNLLVIGFLIGLIIVLITLSTDPGADWSALNTLMIIPWVTALLALAMVGLGYFVWKEKYWSLAGRIHYTLIALAALAFIGFEVFWKLLG